MYEPTISNLPEITIEGAPLPKPLAAALGECWVESGVNLPAAFHITFRESAYTLMQDYAGQLRIGAKVTVQAVADKEGEGTPLITGLVTAIETDYERGSATTVLRGLDHSFKMLRQRRATGYLNMTASEIVRKLAGQDGVDIGTIESTTPSYTLMTQPNISDWQFVKYLADRTGMEADFDHKGKLRFRKPVPASGGSVQIDFGKDVVACRAGVSASDQVTQVTSRGWNVDEKTTVIGKATATSSPDYSIGTTPGTAAGAFGPASLTETGTPYDTQADADRAANSLAADVTASFAEMELEVRGWPDLMPGVVIQLKGSGQPFDGSYTVSATRHSFGRDNRYFTMVRVSGRQVRTLYGLASGSGSGSSMTPRIPGVVNAIVTDVNDPKQQGRVKLRFPWFDDTYVTDWVRSVQFGGYKGGGVISPEVEDEVLVAFDRGSMDHPYVIGGLYCNTLNGPSQHDTPLVTGGKVNRRSIVSRSGNRMELLDAPAKKGVRLQSGDKAHTVFLDETGTTITISSDGSVSIQGETGVSVTSSAKVTVTAPEMTITAPKVNITGDVTINGATQLNGEVNILGALTQEGAANFTGIHTIEGLTEIAPTLNVMGALQLEGVPGLLLPMPA